MYTSGDFFKKITKKLDFQDLKDPRSRAPNVAHHH